MSDNTPPVRDGSGRFVKPEEATSPLAPEEMHPVSRILFGWVSARATPSILLWGTVFVSVALVLVDYGLDRQPDPGLAGVNGFFALFGFAALAGTVLLSWPLGKLLRRSEDYYGEGDPTPRDAGQGGGE